MKCASCYSLNVDGDARCYSCGQPLYRAEVENGFWDKLTSANTPGWAFFLALVCVMIPVISLGGCFPILLGVGGASLCITISRWRWLPGLIRVPVCLVITAVAWIGFASLMVGLSQVGR